MRKSPGTCGRPQRSRIFSLFLVREDAGWPGVVADRGTRVYVFTNFIFTASCGGFTTRLRLRDVGIFLLVSRSKQRNEDDGWLLVALRSWHGWRYLYDAERVASYCSDWIHKRDCNLLFICLFPLLSIIRVDPMPELIQYLESDKWSDPYTVNRM